MEIFLCNFNEKYRDLVFFFSLSFNNINRLPISELLYEMINLGFVDSVVLLPSFPRMMRILNECEPDTKIYH